MCPRLGSLGEMLSFTLSSFEVGNIPQGVAESPCGLISGAHPTSGLDVLLYSSVASLEPLVPVLGQPHAPSGTTTGIPGFSLYPAEPCRSGVDET